MKLDIYDIDDVDTCDDCGTVYLKRIRDTGSFSTVANTCPTCKLRKEIIDTKGRILEGHKPDSV